MFNTDMFSQSTPYNSNSMLVSSNIDLLASLFFWVGIIYSQTLLIKFEKHCLQTLPLENLLWLIQKALKFCIKETS